jgi:hypothetical protein
LAARVDKLVEAAARSLSRREVIGLGASAGLLAACGSEQSAAKPNADWRRRAFGQREVNVCYTPLRVVRTEPELDRQGLTGVVVRKGPSFDADPAPPNAGGETVIPVGAHAARQSVRRAPGPGCPPAAPRPPVDGFVWAYPADDVAGNKSGWVPFDVDGERYLRDDPDYGAHPSDPERWVCGPASHDFDCRSQASQAYCGYDCAAGDTRAGLKYTGRTRRVIGTGSEPGDSAEEYYLRWAASSTPFAYLTPDDVVYELGRKKGYSYGPHLVWWSFVEVREATYVARGTRGFCLEDAFKRPGKRFKPDLG